MSNICARVITIAAASIFFTSLLPRARADEGMWLPNALPLEALQANHNFVPSPELITKLSRSAINFGGASGSFVSASGLVMTNHHVASDSLAQLSTKERDLLKNGFYAPTLADELKVPGLSISIVQQIVDVTDRVNAATKDLPADQIEPARRQVISQIEGEFSKSNIGTECRVVSLYNGGLYHLYVNKRFDDVRLVFAPEAQIGFFGGDTDNFEYPRFCLDAAFFRVYEQDKPYVPEHYLTFSPAGPNAGELALVFGHPGRTQRLLTAADIAHQRDVALPRRLADLYRAEVLTQGFAARSTEHARVAQDDLFGIANGRKATQGQYQGLLDPKIFGAKLAAETALRKAVENDPNLRDAIGDPWSEIEKLITLRAELNSQLSAWSFRGGSAVSYARTLYRLSQELPKPSGQRLSEYRDSSLPRVYANFLADSPTYPFYEQFTLTNGLSRAIEQIGASNPSIVLALNNRAPAQAATDLIASTKLLDPTARAALLEAVKAGQTPTDPMIDFVAIFDAQWRTFEARMTAEVDGKLREAYARVARARFAVQGTKVYPDATGTLRVSFGPIVGYRENGQDIPAFTSLAGLYERATARADRPEFALPLSWINAKPNLNLTTPMNFVCTADIIGGNSGSPVVNTQGQVTGLIFDGNLASLPGAFIYDGTSNRALAVDSRVILHALDRVYNAQRLVSELSVQ